MLRSTSSFSFCKIFFGILVVYKIPVFNLKLNMILSVVSSASLRISIFLIDS